MKRTLKETGRKHFFDSLEMLAGFIEQCPGDLWHKKRGGFIFWQQLFHCLESIHYWLRLNDGQYQAPFAGKRVFPGMEKEAVDQLSRKELGEYLQSVKSQAEQYFNSLTDDKLLENSIVDSEKSNCDVIFLQIRHIQYHVGHCNSIFREQGIAAVSWIE